MTNSSALITFKLINSEPSLGSQFLGLLGALIVGALILVVNLAGKKIMKKINEHGERKEIKAYFNAMQSMI